jgi:hypothetical protein
MTPSGWDHTWIDHVEAVKEHARHVACPDCRSGPGHSCMPLDEHPHDARLQAGAYPTPEESSRRQS